jgi:2-oxoglutarate dehydrogenase E1 component
VVVCGGKVYYDLLEARQKRRSLDDVASCASSSCIPFPRKELAAELKRFGAATEVVWCQEEPQNQGAWYQIQHHLRACLQASRRSATRVARVALPGRGSPGRARRRAGAARADALVNPLNGDTTIE